jgi:hypothetical protein
MRVLKFNMELNPEIQYAVPMLADCSADINGDVEACGTHKILLGRTSVDTQFSDLVASGLANRP